MAHVINRPEEDRGSRQSADGGIFRFRQVSYCRLILAFWVIIGACIILFQARADKNHEFMGIIGSGINAWVTCDSELYLDMIDQSQHGAWLFNNRFTSEVNAPRYLNSIWTVVGKASNPLRLSPVAAFTVLRFLAVAIFFLTLAKFLSETVRYPGARRIALVLIAFGGGIGWLCYLAGQATGNNALSMLFIDGRKSEFTCFLPLVISPHLTIATGFMLLIFARLASSVRKCKFDMSMPILTFLLATFHPYDVVTVGIVGGVYMLLLLLRDRRLNRSGFISYAASMLLALPVIIYHWWSIRTTPDLGGLSSQNGQSPAALSQYLASLLPLGLFAVLTLVNRLKHIRQASPGQLLVAAWALSLPLMIMAYPAVPFARKLIMGMMIPIGVLAAEWILIKYQNRADAGGFLKRVAVPAIVAVSLMGSLVSLGMIVKAAQQRADLYYVHKSDVNALRWLAPKSSADDVVLSHNSLGMLIPRLSNKRAMLGHRVQTVSYSEKEQLARNLVQNGSVQSEALSKLRHYRVRWIILSKEERKWWRTIEASSNLSEVYTDHSTQVYRIVD